VEYPGDGKVVKMCQKNNRQGYEMLFNRYRRYIYTICWRSTGHEQDALDLTQEVLLKIVRNIGSFDSERPLTPWIRRITVNICINFSRGVSREILTDFTDAESAGGNIADENEATMPEQSHIKNENKKMVDDALASLPGKERTVLIMRHMEDRSYAEIAGIMNVPEGTIKTWIFRGRRMLKRALEDMKLWKGV
jgi:RNA polymerase sigma-70 factor (ECF subfamily)